MHEQAAEDDGMGQALATVPSGGDMPEEGTTVPITPERPAELMAQLGTMRLSPRQRKVLEEQCHATPDITSIKPTGEVYVSAVHYRNAMNKVFGPLQWALRPLEPEKLDIRTGNNGNQTSIMYQRTALVINGRVVGWAIGECPYHPKNSRMTYGDAAAGVQSNVLMRLCKPLGIYAECWDARYGEQFRREHCVQVWLDNKKKRYGGDEEESNRPVWRRVDAEPFYNERDITETSPNKARWQRQRSEWLRNRAGVDAGDDDTGGDQGRAPTGGGDAETRSAGSEEAPELIVAFRETRPGRLWCLRGARSGDCYTESPDIFASGRAACHSKSPVILVWEWKVNDRSRKYRALSEILPPRARERQQPEVDVRDEDIPNFGDAYNEDPGDTGSGKLW
jgi:hypothetical protein